MSKVAIDGVAAGVVIVLLGVVEWISRAQPRTPSFLASVTLGEDQRTSTSKTFILLWTLLVAWALIALLIAGELISRHACTHAAKQAARLATQTCAHDPVGVLQLGWTHFLHGGLVGSYLILLGIPAGAGVAAKAITQSQAQDTTSVKTTKRLGLGGLRSRLKEVFSSDDGSTDIGDFQYMIFNLITATYFVARFLRPDVNGLPVIPDTLLGLTGVSASLYVGKKAVSRNQPVVSGVFPSLLRAGERFTVVGTGLTPDPAAEPANDPRITIDGRLAPGVTWTVDGSLSAIVPDGLADPSGGSVPRQLQVLSPYAAITPAFPVQCM